MRARSARVRRAIYPRAMLSPICRSGNAQPADGHRRADGGRILPRCRDASISTTMTFLAGGVVTAAEAAPMHRGRHFSEAADDFPRAIMIISRERGALRNAAESRFLFASMRYGSRR